MISARDPTGSFQASASDTAAENLTRSHSSWTRRGDRFSARCTTCAREFPADATDWCCTQLPRPALQPPHQNRHRGAQTRHALRIGRGWPVKRATRKLCRRAPATILRGAKGERSRLTLELYRGKPADDSRTQPQSLLLDHFRQRLWREPQPRLLKRKS